MIKEIRIQPISKYGRYFLSTEADDEPQPKSNTKVIDVKPNNRRKMDFTNGSDDFDEPENEPSEEMPDTSVSDEEGADNPNPEAEPSVQDDGGDTGGENPTADGPDTSTGEEGGDAPTGEDGPDTGGGDGDVDFTDDSGMDDTGGEDANAETDENNNDKKGPGLDFDSTRKYNLFENYMSLDNAVNNYIAKLEKSMTDEYSINQVYRTAITKLREIHELCYDYMTLRFEISTYVQSLLFFQELIVMVQMVFDFIEKNKKTIKKALNIKKH